MSVHAPVSAAKVTVTTLQKMREAQDRITMLSCYDASFAALLDDCGVDMPGDSLDGGAGPRFHPAGEHGRERSHALVARREAAMVAGDLPAITR
jgi:hypothetical protein